MFDLIGRVFIDLGDIVVVEVLIYFVVFNVFKFYDFEFILIFLDDDGMKVDVLEEKFKKLKVEGKRIKFVYIVLIF